MSKKFTIEVYINNGLKFQYDVDSPESVREHAAAIIQSGYRSNDGKSRFVHWPPHSIVKVKCNGCIPTNYPDVITGT